MTDLSSIATFSLIGLLAASSAFFNSPDSPSGTLPSKSVTIERQPQKINFKTCVESAQSELFFSKLELDEKLQKMEFTNSQVMRRKAAFEYLFFQKKIICKARYS
ncbi:MAG: hypothetical protein H8E32_01355 [Nitrospinae bacterium]|nr:hypothetical protein [Nitrospinota bacterium]